MNELELIALAKKKVLSGVVLTKSEIISLLDIELYSEADEALRRAANEAARELTENSAYVWAAIGADYAPCPMNCEFCSLGEKWGVVTEKKVFDDDTIIADVQSYVLQGARFIVLRTTEFYSLEVLAELVKKIRAKIAGEYEIILNVGEFDGETADKLFRCGVSGIYHALRLREGINTPFKPAERLKTMESVKKSKLKLISLVEPVGVEHTNEELADNFLNLVAYNTCISGAMARVPVKATPLGSQPIIDDDKLAHIIAVLRLSGGGVVRDICVHPNSKQAIMSGANVVVVEKGAIPRDENISGGEWREFSIADAKKLFMECGYEVYNYENRSDWL